MRLTALTLTNYGNFQSERIEFCARAGTVNLLMAPNGGGKSVLRGAFCDLLFGIHGQSPMGFRYGYPGMRILAEAVDEAGTPFTFGRRKGQGNTLIGLDGAALDPASLVQRLGGVDRAQLERLFALDTERLRAGEKDLLASEGKLGAALVSGAGGPRDLRALRRRLEESRDALAPARRAASRPFYVALDGFVGARKRKEAALLRPDRWKKMQQALDEARAAQAEQNAIAQAASAEIARLERIRRVRPVLHALDAAAGWLYAHPDAPELAAGLKPRLDTVRAQIVIAEQRLLREQQQAADLATRRDAVLVNDAMRAEAEAINALVEQSGEARKAQADLPNIVGRADARRAAIIDRLRELGRDLPTDRAGEAVAERAAVARTRRLIKAGGARQAAAQTSAADVARLADELARLQAEVALLEPPADVSLLAACMRDIRTEGDPLRHQRDLAARCRQAAADLDTALGRVPGWVGSAGALQRVAVLAPEAYQRHAEALRTAQALTERRQDEAAACRRDRDAGREALDRHAAAGAVPDAEALAAARRHRGQGWDLIFRTAFSAQAPTAEEERAFTGGQPLPMAYERAVGAADTIADQRLRDAELVARIEAERAALEQAEAKCASAEALHRQAHELQQAAGAAWTTACATLPLGAGPAPGEVLAFLAARDKAIDAAGAAALADAERGDLAETHRRWSARLAALLGVAMDAEAPSLADLLPRAEARLAAAQDAAQAHAAGQGRLDATDRELAKARAAQRQADAGLATWQSDWDAALVALGRPVGEDPAVTEEVLDSLDALAQAHREHCDLQERVAGMRRDIERFSQDAAAFAARLTPDLDHDDAFAVVTALRTRLQAEQEAANERALLHEQAQAAAETAAAAQHHLAAMQDDLRATLMLIGALTPEAAEHRLQLAAERAGHAAALADAQTRLADAGDLLPAETLRDEVAAVPLDDLLRLRDAASERREAAQRAAQDEAARAAELTQQISAAEDATEAVDAAADQQAAVATMGRVLEEALVYHVAAEMLDKALTAVERETEPAMLQRITALFAALTDGAYTRVLSEAGDDSAARLTLVQRAYPDEHQAVADLSEGTRDQLYLALRLAAVEAQVDAAPPLPFIGDDILQSFDDDRALAALRVLREVSQTVQVILLTHHRHVLDLAERLPQGSVHVCRAAATLEPA